VILGIPAADFFYLPVKEIIDQFYVVFVSLFILRLVVRAAFFIPILIPILTKESPLQNDHNRLLKIVSRVILGIETVVFRESLGIAAPLVIIGLLTIARRSRFRGESSPTFTAKNYPTGKFPKPISIHRDLPDFFRDVVSSFLYDTSRKA
jgi:hypothetical protein